jgi:hypothetical protein
MRSLISHILADFLLVERIEAVRDLKSLHGDYQVHIHNMGQWVFGLKPTLLSI